MSTRYEKYKDKYKAYSAEYYRKNKDQIKRKRRKAPQNKKLTQIKELKGFQMEFFIKKKREKVK